MLKFVSCALVMSVAGVAHAGGKVEPATARATPTFVDESEVFVKLLSEGKNGYRYEAGGIVVGFTKGDRLRLELSQKGKVLGSASCGVKPIDESADASFACEYDGKPVKAAGAIDLDLIYEDDKTDKHYLVRRFSSNAVQYKPDKWSTWQITPNDLLGTAYADTHEDLGEWLKLKLWLAGPDSGKSNVLRCSANGKTFEDIEIGNLGTKSEIEANTLPKENAPAVWRYNRVEIEAKPFRVGARPAGARADKAWPYLADHPGAWECQFRVDGRTVRQLSFTVDKKGFVEPHPISKGLPARKGVVMIDVRIPKDAGYDQRIKPAELRKSRGFGLAWPSDPGVKAIHDAFPPAFENANPQPPPRKSKRLSGLDHKPQRFVDESSTSLKVQRATSGKGYSAHVYAVVAGVTANSDRFRLDWKQGGKVVATAACSWTREGSLRGINFDQLGEVSCEIKDKPLSAKGAIEADLVYMDESDGNDYVVRTYKVNVVKLTSHGDEVWQVVPDDVLATAWVRHPDNSEHSLEFAFWLAREQGFGEATMRCTADGKQIPDLEAGNVDSPGYTIEARQQPKTGNASVYYWRPVTLDVKVLWGKAEKHPKWPLLRSTPGAWDCTLRIDGKPVRQFLFTVDKDGKVQADPSQVSPTSPTLPEIVPIELRYPKDMAFDNRVRPDAMKKSRGFGLPWPKAPTKPFPAASGLKDPK